MHQLGIGLSRFAGEEWIIPRPSYGVDLAFAAMAARSARATVAIKTRVSGL